MTNRIEISDLDVIYISYDEPNCEQNWAENLKIVPWAQRVHGVKGFDAAHRAAAELSETDRFITIDGDNILDPSFLNLALDMDEKTVYSWSGYNVVNGLSYGNGGVKCWTKEFALNMNSHENSDDTEHAVDFCWKPNYRGMPGVYSRTIVNGSRVQAFRAGFREGVKLCLDRGVRIDPSEFSKRIWKQNQQRLAIWISVGIDMPHGDWCMYGAALGMVKMADPNWDHTVINDFDKFNSIYQEYGTGLLRKPISTLCDQILAEYGLHTGVLGAWESKFFRDNHTIRVQS